jgi:uncharacterized repeat protein (TIGR04138 family)
MKANFQEALQILLQEDPRYQEGAYVFVREALDFTIKELAKPASGEARHVTGKELLDGFRQLARREFGPMARTVLGHWGLREPVDVGHVVYNLIGKGVLGKSDRDRLDDFAEGPDFETAFVKPFLPQHTAPAPAQPSS